MIYCPVKSLKAWKDLVEIQGEDISYALWNAYDGMVPDSYYTQIKKSSDISDIFKEEFQPKTLFDVVNKLAKLNKTAQGIGSNKKLEETLKKAGISPEHRQLLMSVLERMPELRKLKLQDVFSVFTKEVIKGNEDPYYETIVNPINVELEKIILDYFKPFNITTVELDNLKEKFGVDTLGAFDILNKVVYLSKNRNEFTVPEEFGHVFVELMGTSLRRKDTNPIYKFLYENVESWEGYARVLKDYEKIYTRPDGSPDLIKIKKEAIGQAIGLALVSNVRAKQNDSFWKKIQDAIKSILNLLSGINYVSFNMEVDAIAKDIINKNYSKLNALKKDISNYKLLDYAETIENQNKIDGGTALEFMQYFSELGNVITGSLAYRQQGTVYRPDMDALHDIDMIVPYSTHKLGLMPYRLSIPKSEQGRLLEVLLNQEYFKKIKEKYPDMLFMASYFDKEGKYVTVNAVWSKDNKLSEKFNNLTGGYAERLDNFTKEEKEKIYLFDFFLRELSEGDVATSEDSLYNLKLANSDYAFYEKVGSMKRPKDIFDYQTWKPFDQNKKGVESLSRSLMYYQLNPEATQTSTEIKEGIDLQIQQVEEELQKEQVAEQRVLKYEDSNTKVLMERFEISYLPPKTIPKKSDAHKKAKEVNSKLRSEGSAYKAIVTKQRATYAGKLREIWVVRFVRNNSKNIVTSDRYGAIPVAEAEGYVQTVTNDETVESVDELIDNVLNSEELTDDVRELLELIKSLGLKLPINFINSLSDTALMFTDGVSITINTAHKVHPKVWAEALVHELVHATAENALQNNEAFARKVNAMYRKYLNRKGTSTSYGFTNESEFIAELMSNPAFRQELEAMDNMWTRFLRFVSELFGIKSGSELNKLTLQIKDIIAENSNNVQLFERKDIKYSSDPKESMEKILKSVSDRIRTFQQRNKSKDLIEPQEKLLGEIKKEYDAAKYLQGMLTYVDNVDKFVTEDDLFKRIGDLLDAAEKGDFDKILKTGGSVRDLGTFIYSYMNMMDDILQSLTKYTPTNEDEKLVIAGIKEKIGKINTLLTEYKAHYADLSHIILSRFLEPFGMGESADQIKQALMTPAKDISAATRWLMSLQESGDMILGMLDVAFKSFYSDARRESLEITKDLLIEKKKLEASGIKDTAWVYQRDDKGVPTGDYIIETQTALFLNERDLRFKELEQKFKEAEDAGTPIAETVKDSMRKKTYKALSKKYNIVSDTYWETAVAFEEFMQEKREELGARFDAWKKMNTYRRSDGELIISLNTNPAYKEITSNNIKEDFYWKLVGTQVQLQKQFPPRFRNYRIVPQIRMDVIERVKTGDVNRMKDAFTELYQIKEDDANYGVDFGIKDERGKIVNFIPIYFTKKLSNMKDLSTDAVSSMIVFADMATRRNKLSQIVDILELGKEVIRDRGVFQTSNRGKILKNISNILGIKHEEDLTKDSPGNIYNRLEDFMDMMLYGKMKHDGKYEKAIDTFVYYTSVNNLALNLFAGIANANMGKIQNLIEATSKQFFGMDALAFAKKAYIAGLPGLMGDVGARMDKSRLGLWIEQHNILDDFEQKVWGVNADRATRGEQLADLGSMFFLSTAVENNLHTEPALALAFNYRYDSKKERFVFKEEFFEELNKLKEAQRIEIQNLTGDNLTDKTKEILNKNKAKIESLEERLNSEWKAIEKDNYYEAFERYEADPGSFKMRLNNKYKNNATDAKKFENRVHSVNHAIAGIYNKLDRSAGQKYAIVRAAFNFRKWMIPAFNRRFKAYYKNYELQSELEGYYRTTGRFLQQLYKDIREGKVSVMKNWYSLKDFEKANLRRSASELAVFFLALAVMQALSHIEGDDDENWVLNMAAYQSRRLVTELGAMTPILPFTVKEGLKLLDSPLPMANQFTELSRLVEFWNWFEELESGKYKGMYKIQRQLIRSVPPFKTVHDTFHPEEKIKFFNR